MVRRFQILLALATVACGSESGPVGETASCPPGWNTGTFFDSASAADVTACLDAGENPNARAPDGRAPLHFAATRDDPAIITLLISAGARTTLKTLDNKTPLCMAAQNGTSGAVTQALIDGGANVDGICRHSWGTNFDVGPEVTPLCLAAGFGVPGVVRVLLEGGANRAPVCSASHDVNNDRPKVTALWWAEQALEHGAAHGLRAEPSMSQAIVDMLRAAG